MKISPLVLFLVQRKRQAMPQDSHSAPGAACWGFPKPLLNTEFHSVAARPLDALNHDFADQLNFTETKKIPDAKVMNPPPPALFSLSVVLHS